MTTMTKLGWNVVCCSVLAFASGALVGCASDDKDAAPQLDFTEFDETVEQFLIDNSLEGATAVVVHRDWGVMHQSGYGAFDAERISLIASSSKVVSVGMVMRLDDQGVLDINAPVGDYLADWTGSAPGKSDITLAQMLSNSSGMTGLTDNPLYVPYLCQYVEGGTLSGCAESIYTADDGADLIEPDTEFHYGGGQWQLAGGIAAKVSGKSWAQLFEDTYVTACGLEVSGYTNQFQSAQLGYPTYFDGDVTKLPTSDNPSIEGGMYTNVTDYSKLLLMHLRGGMCGDNRVLSADAVDTMQADRIGEVYDGSTGLDTAFPGYGLGWWVSRAVPGLVQDAGAYGAIPWIDNERGYAAIIIIEENTAIGAQLAMQGRPILEALFDDAQP